MSIKAMQRVSDRARCQAGTILPSVMLINLYCASHVFAPDRRVRAATKNPNRFLVVENTIPLFGRCQNFSATKSLCQHHPSHPTTVAMSRICFGCVSEEVGP
jgi:hypothetical protein